MMYDVIIIGAGPAGYIAAERLGAAGKKVLLVDTRQTLGGTCLNVGCIPTKSLLNSAKLYAHAKDSARFGVVADNVSFDWQAMQKWKDDTVRRLCAGVAATEKKLGVEVLQGHAEIVSPTKIRIAGGEVPSDTDPANTVFETKAILICSGSEPVIPNIPGVQDNPLVVDSTGLLSITALPKRLAIIGGGVIGIEFAGLFSSLGTEVTVIEMMDEIIPNMDRELSPLFRRALKGVNFRLGCTVKAIDTVGVVSYTTKDGKDETTDADLVLMAVGRRPVLQGLGLEAVGIKTTNKGITVNETMQTSVPGIWAAGDVTGLMQLAHAAYRQAEVAVEDILNYLGRGEVPNTYHQNALPWVVYGLTEAAGVGITEQEAEAKGISIIKKTIPMAFSGRFVAENGIASPGVLKVIADAATRRLLGVHAVGSYASEFIWGAGALIEEQASIEAIRKLIFPHPTVCELIREAVWEM
ncbi:MAG: dihydrolipoyl dehydrogenase [Spirochaetaceae bacterium]|jgi:dihydrolipoamide dehydrogenase|nr:dihydrolipoyl dehydrogenase [Spirochaetaceae bacterium]